MNDMEAKPDFVQDPEYLDESKFSNLPETDKAALREKAKPYFNQYVLKKVREKPLSGPEMIQNDMLFHSLIHRMNQLAKDTLILRVQGEKEKAEHLYRFLHLHRKFVLVAFGLEEPNWEIIQNEWEDDLQVLQNLSSSTVTREEVERMEEKLNNM